MLPPIATHPMARSTPCRAALLALLSSAIVLCTSCSLTPSPSPTPAPCRPGPDPVRGDCRAPSCGTATTPSPSDVPPDDGNPCTEETCSPGPAHPPAPAGKFCGEGKVCNATGTCLDCIPGASLCTPEGRRLCSSAGKWEERSACESTSPVCSSGACVSIKQVVAGLQHACALLSDGTVRCWGTNVEGSLGTAVTAVFRAQVPQRLPLAGVVQLAAGPGRLTCARHSDGKVSCWGPRSARGLEGATDLAVGAQHGCAVVHEGAVLCWGNNAHGQLADATLQDHAEPAVVAGLPAATKVACSESHTCAILADSTVRCWGSNLWGESGLARSEGFPSSSGPVRAGDRATSPAIVEGLSGATALALGTGRSCALMRDGAVWCWGDQPDKQGQSFEHRPRAVSRLDSVTSLSASGWQLCAVDRGEAKCTGLNGEGQLGDGTFRERDAMGQVAGLGGAIGIATSREHGCAWLEDGGVACWGSDGCSARRTAERIRW